jgi:hypothetical protein
VNVVESAIAENGEQRQAPKDVAPAKNPDCPAVAAVYDRRLLSGRSDILAQKSRLETPKPPGPSLAKRKKLS